MSVCHHHHRNRFFSSRTAELDRGGEDDKMKLKLKMMKVKRQQNETNQNQSVRNPESIDLDCGKAYDQHIRTTELDVLSDSVFDFFGRINGGISY